MFGELVQQIIQNGLSESSTEIGVWNNQMEWKPALDLMDNDDEICLYLTLPGVKNSSIDIDILNNRMMISGEREKPLEQQNRFSVRVDTVDNEINN